MLAPATGRPMDLARLSTITRTALIRGGLEDVSLGDLCRWSRRDDRHRALLAALKETGSLTREEVMTRLGITKNAALTLLNALRAEGAVLRVGSRYYPADAVTPPDAQPAAVLAFLRENGPAARKAIAARLGLPPAQTAALLRRMAAEGRLVLTGKRYALPTDSPD